MSATPATLSARVAAEWRAEVGGIEVLFGHGALAGVGELARELGGRRALLVTDPGVRAAGHADRAASALVAAGVAVQVFDAVGENPTTRQVEAGRDAAAGWGADLLVGLGGGSAMDCAKGINFLLTNGGRMEDYHGFGLAALPMLPAIGVPTTAGTGSEAQSYALISQAESHRKMACGDRKARFRIVVLDPELIASAPRRVAAAAGLDALAHAVESIVCRTANPVSRMLSSAAWRLLEPNLERALAAPATPAVNRAAEPAEPAGAADAAGAVLLGAHFAGAAIEVSMLGAAHACANPLTARYGVVHGAAVALMLPHVVRFNSRQPASAAPAAAGYAGLDGCPSGQELAARIEALRAAAGLPERLRDAGVEAAALGELAREAAQQWTAAFNPRQVGEDDLRRLYELAF
jgi:alcohol dehydrogenase